MSSETIGVTTHRGYALWIDGGRYHALKPATLSDGKLEPALALICTSADERKARIDELEGQA